MKILSFTCAKLNSFITREIRFYDDVSFLHGINGSGKTTTPRAIASLLTPDPIWLLNGTYENLEVRLEHDDKKYTIAAKKGDGATVTIKISGETELEDSISPEDVRIFGKQSSDEYFDPDELPLRIRAYTESVRTFAFINSLPTPIFLGLDRTTLTPSAIARPPRTARSRSVHPFFRTQLDDAIVEAERLIGRQLSLLSSERNKVFEELRNQFVLSLFGIPEGQDSRDLKHLQEIASKFESMRYSVTYALERININKNEIASVVEPFFREMKRMAEEARIANKEFQAAKDKSAAATAYIARVSPFLNLAPSISIIERTLNKVEEANKNEKLLARPLETYQRIMDSFFGDSKKALVFIENAVRVRLPSERFADLTSLSSGERQIFVLITHLFFNPAIRGENVLLIDEPELSLHLKWQRQFVAAIREASPNTQMILATHSPEIIYNRDDRLIELVI